MPALATTDGRTLTYLELGSGPPLICHPGGPGIPALIFDDLGGLDAERTLVLLNPRGVGGSDAADSYGLEDYAADLDDLRAHLGLEKIDLFGHSAGGFTSRSGGRSPRALWLPTGRSGSPTRSRTSSSGSIRPRSG